MSDEKKRGSDKSLISQNDLERALIKANKLDSGRNQAIHNQNIEKEKQERARLLTNQKRIFIMSFSKCCYKYFKIQEEDLIKFDKKELEALTEELMIRARYWAMFQKIIWHGLFGIWVVLPIVFAISFHSFWWLLSFFPLAAPTIYIDDFFSKYFDSHPLWESYKYLKNNCGKNCFPYQEIRKQLE